MFSSYRRFSDAARLSFKHGIFAQIHGIFCWNNAIPHPPKWQVQFSKTYDCGASKVGAHDAATVLLLLPKTIVARCAWPHRGRSFQWEHCRYEKSMAYKNDCEIQKQWKIEVVRRSNEWANGCWDVNEMKWTYWRDRINARMTQWVREWLREWKNDWMWERTNEQTNEWTNNEWANQRTNGLMTEWLNESMNAWITMTERNTEWVSQWLSEPTDQWSMAEATNKWMNECWVNEWESAWMNDWLNDWLNGWMSNRTNERTSCLFPKSLT
jgi:hypothetical protein